MPSGCSTWKCEHDKEIPKQSPRPIKGKLAFDNELKKRMFDPDEECKMPLCLRKERHSEYDFEDLQTVIMDMQISEGEGRKSHKRQY